MDSRNRLKGITRAGSNPITNPDDHSPIHIQNRFIAEVVGPDGRVKQRIDHQGNIMASYGLNRLSEFLATDAGGGSAFANTMAIGTGSTAAATSDTGLGNSTQLCGTFSRSDKGERTVEFQATFASDGNASAIHEVGIFQTNQATASMIARSVLGTDSINRGSADEIRASYQLIATTA